MLRRTVSEDDLRRLKIEREEADRRYNDALTALDAALQSAPDLPHAPPPPDEGQLPPLNHLWEILPTDPPGAGWRARVTRLIRRAVAPMLQRQQAFNSALVDHLNRGAAPLRETHGAIDGALAALRDHLAALVSFQSRLIVYLQQITAYVDTKDRESAGLMRRLNEDNGVHLAALAAGLNGVSEELLKRWESMVARERRYEARVSALAAADKDRATGQDEIRSTLGVLQQASLTLKRELERLLAAGPVAAPRHRASGDVSGPSGSRPRMEAGGAPSAFTDLDSYKYVGFEDEFRGSEREIRARVAEYLPYFDGASDVLDVGCGRGEFLDVLRDAGVGARGVDVNAAMVDVCRRRGLEVEAGDALGYLASVADGALGGLFSAQVVEHFDPAYLTGFLETAFHKLRPGSTIVLETINPACWAAFFESYIRDITHVRPLHPDTLRYLLTASGFQRVRIQYGEPYPEHGKLRPLPVGPDHEAAVADVPLLADVVEIVNANVEKINSLLFSFRDYAAIGERV